MTLLDFRFHDVLVMPTLRALARYLVVKVFASVGSVSDHLSPESGCAHLQSQKTVSIRNVKIKTVSGSTAVAKTKDQVCLGIFKQRNQLLRRSSSQLKSEEKLNLQ